jgi:hypothetical protein
LFEAVAHWPIWSCFTLVHARATAAENIFGFAEYLASLALFLVVMTTSDFRFTYRLSTARFPWKKIGFWVALTIGVALLATDVWFQNGLPIPVVLSNPNNIKAILGFVFLAFVFQVIFIALVRPPIYSKRNSKHFFNSNYHFIHQGDAARLQVVAEELMRSVPAIIQNAEMLVRVAGRPDIKPPLVQGAAHDFLLLIGDDRFCRIVVDKVPSFALHTFSEAQKYDVRLPIFQFARNIGQGFIRNTSSAFYQEDSGYYSGFIGYVRPITKVIYGHYKFVEGCASSGASPLETDYREFGDFTAIQMEGYTRAALAFLESCLGVTKGRPYPHSYALARMFSSFESSLSGVAEIDGKINVLSIPAYGRLQATVHFIKTAIELVENHAIAPRHFRVSQPMRADIYDDIANLIFDTIFAASSVTSPPWTSWSIQHNAVWSDIFGLQTSPTRKIIALKVRRLLYNEIKQMNEWANFKGARVLGYCLHVLGLVPTDRHKGYHKEFFPLQAAAISWVKRNFGRLLEDHPKVAAACLQGSVTYDRDNHRLVKTFSGQTEKEPQREFLEIDRVP